MHSQSHLVFLPFSMPPKRLALPKNALSNVFAFSKPSSRNFEMDHLSGHMHLILKSELEVMLRCSPRNIFGADNKYH